MDEFSWFVGIYEGEGSISGYAAKDRPASKRWELQIKMCDQDTVERVGKFLGYKPVPVKHHLKDNPHWSPAWVVQVRNREALWNLGQKMYPHLSKRRQAQWDEFFEDMRACKSRFEGTSHAWRYVWVS